MVYIACHACLIIIDFFAAIVVFGACRGGALVPVVVALRLVAGMVDLSLAWPHTCLIEDHARHHGDINVDHAGVAVVDATPDADQWRPPRAWVEAAAVSMMAPLDHRVHDGLWFIKDHAGLVSWLEENLGQHHGQWLYHGVGHWSFARLDHAALFALVWLS